MIHSVFTKLINYSLRSDAESGCIGKSAKESGELKRRRKDRENGLKIGRDELKRRRKGPSGALRKSLRVNRPQKGRLKSGSLSQRVLPWMMEAATAENFVLVEKTYAGACYLSHCIPTCSLTHSYLCRAVRLGGRPSPDYMPTWHWYLSLHRWLRLRRRLPQ